MRYLEVAIRCQREAADAVGNALAELTGGGYAVDDPMDIIQNRSSWEITDLVAGDPAWVVVKGWLADEGDVEGARIRLEERLASIRELGLGTIEPPAYAWVQEEDWANAWKAYFKPTRVGERLMIIPSWESYELQPQDLPLYLDPGMAFGTGTHPTTSLCLRKLEAVVQPGMRVLDVGTGSGILAIAAARLGAAPVVGIDIDPVAVRVAKENAQRNGVTIDVRAGTLDQVETDECDLIIANIIASIIIDILPDVASRMKMGGKFLASGIIAEKKQAVADAMTATWLLPIEIREEGGWVAILATKA
ncbi:MAG TPA: 50S ribosomal protein L11 methyltransferase [Symbiobacteriaceae bacterium]|nr:50S ribosomal protein L11 methyltransferase [Symbiobacteriaceae bacterium]